MFIHSFKNKKTKQNKNPVCPNLNTTEIFSSIYTMGNFVFVFLKGMYKQCINKENNNRYISTVNNFS